MSASCSIPASVSARISRRTIRCWRTSTNCSAWDFPLLAGTSRKSFVGRTVGKRRGGEDAPPDERLYGSLAAMVASILHGAHIVRVHDVRPAVEAAAIADEILARVKSPFQQASEHRRTLSPHTIPALAACYSNSHP